MTWNRVDDEQFLLRVWSGLYVYIATVLMRQMKFELFNPDMRWHSWMLYDAKRNETMRCDAIQGCIWLLLRLLNGVLWRGVACCGLTRSVFFFKFDVIRLDVVFILTKRSLLSPSHSISSVGFGSRITYSRIERSCIHPSNQQTTIIIDRTNNRNYKYIDQVHCIPKPRFLDICYYYL